jgi:Ca2+/H+ antiporter, TMEM165/GDT1 family
MTDWIHTAPSALAAFLASLVEFVEALTIVLAVGTVRGWRSAWLGAGAGTILLAVLILAFGHALERIPLAILQLAIGVLLLLFGLRWLRKAALRATGVIPLHDETVAFASKSALLRINGQHTRRTSRLDALAIITSGKAVLIEGIEVVFIVIGVGTVGHTLAAATIGATAAGIVVVLLGLALRAPLARIPENTLKFTVGVLLSSFGTFWVGEGLQLTWPGSDLALPALAGGFLATAATAIALGRRLHASHP